MPRAQEPSKGPWALSHGLAGTTLALMQPGRNGGRYRLRTMLRASLPYFVSDRIPKGPRDCGKHDWYRQDAHTDACYHCQVGHRVRPSEAEPQREPAALAL